MESSDNPNCARWFYNDTCQTSSLVLYQRGMGLMVLFQRSTSQDHSNYILGGISGKRVSNVNTVEKLDFTKIAKSICNDTANAATQHSAHESTQNTKHGNYNTWLKWFKEIPCDDSKP